MSTELSFDAQVAALGLTEPQLIETPGFEATYQELWQLFQSLDPRYQLQLDSDPVVKVLQAWAYDRMKLVKLYNHAARGGLLAFAKGSVLDHIGLAWGVTRLTVSAGNPAANPPILPVMESDDRFRYRIQQRLTGWSCAGTVASYRYWAMTADPRVRDVFVYSPDHKNGYNMGGQVVIVILSEEEGHVASQELLDVVRDVVTSDSVKAVNDVLVVTSAIPKAVDFNLSVKLNRSAPYSVFQGLSAALMEAFAEKQKLGVDITHSWINDVLFKEGVHSITVLSPTSDQPVMYNEFPIIGSVTLAFAGYADQDGFNVDEVERLRTERYIYDTYVKFCVENHRTRLQIESDLNKVPRPGIAEPTVIGLAQYLGIVAIKNADGSYIEEDEIVYLIWKKLSTRYL